MFWVGGVWLYSIILVLCSVKLLLTIVRNVTYFSILIWQKWTKYWTKVVIHGNLVVTRIMPKGITNLSTLRYITARSNINWSDCNTLLWFFSNEAKFLHKGHFIPTPVCTGIQGVAYIKNYRLVFFFVILS